MKIAMLNAAAVVLLVQPNPSTIFDWKKLHA